MLRGFSSLFGGSEPAPYSPPEGIPSPDEPRELVLYKFDSCPFCYRVMSQLPRLGLELQMRDTTRDPGARAALRERTGRTQVPCLFIDDVPLFESADILAWLRAYSAAGAKAA